MSVYPLGGSLPRHALASPTVCSGIFRERPNPGVTALSYIVFLDNFTNFLVGPNFLVTAWGNIVVFQYLYSRNQLSCDRLVFIVFTLDFL